MTSYRRPAGTAAAARVAPLELFYDLVFVFAVTQVSHHLLHDLTWAGAGQSALLLTAVWWSWNYTAWVTNELDTDQDAVRLLVVAAMLASLLMAIALPRALTDRGLLFAASYVTLQVGRHLFLALGTARAGSLARTRAMRITVWFAASGAFWLAGGALDRPSRVPLWTAAALIDLAGPLWTYRVPGLARLDPAAWQVVSSHFAERFQLFVIIALGESIVLTGTTTAERELTAARTAALVVRSRARRPCGGSTSTGRPRPASTCWTARPYDGPRRRGTPTPTCTRSSSPASWWRPPATSSSSPTLPRTCRGLRPSRSAAGRRSTWPPWSCSAGAPPDGGRRRGRAVPGRAWLCYRQPAASQQRHWPPSCSSHCSWSRSSSACRAGPEHGRPHRVVGPHRRQPSCRAGP